MATNDFFTIHAEGFERMRARLSGFAQRYPQEVKAALKTEAEIIMTESKKQVPVDTGSLKNSGFVNEPTQSGQTISIKLGYGGIATKVNPRSGEITTVYAIYVHENMGYHHTVGKAKFLEDPIAKSREKLMNRIIYRVKRLLESGGVV